METSGSIYTQSSILFIARRHTDLARLNDHTPANLFKTNMALLTRLSRS